ncbi:MAG: Hpt domain-containing protein [Bacteroidetes bacterium]|jgi:HPt (histidine-containing phosphotransfer) domain-containing protein|nr:Hpt domain-containing protein [Bacteroidota bacterium]MBK9318538.1 Hpt domain-containing protein [Bacteroidota bacterium]MBK9400104.1 Hpt domain-containing protein [Bacteroidota bacterium]MBL0097997.1 Hpt domain-containing protein [Bacteroidota bacterium]MBL0098198.1 Hpt domain-containing protein [Bacteroidota bacterium]
MDQLSQITDLSYLRSLTGGANDKMIKYIRMFLTGAPISIQQMELYTMSKDWSGLRQTAHALKPQLGYFGAKGSEELVKDIEKMAGEQSNLDRIPVQIENFKKQYEIISAELEKALRDLGN